MNDWVIFIIIVGSISLWVWFSNKKDEMKVKVAEYAENELNVTKKINEAKITLSKKKYFTNFEVDIDNLVRTDKTIGNCPKCKTGYLQVTKRYTGQDTVYGRYPDYEKYIKCFDCGYTESYSSLKRRRSNIKMSNSAQFKRDFEEAYRI